MKQKELDKLLAKWQKILRLNDWAVDARFVKANQVGEGRAAEVSIERQHKAATIRIVHPEMLDNQLTVEQMLCHELLHLHLVPFQPHEHTLEYDLMEQVVNILAEALCKLEKK